MPSTEHFGYLISNLGPLTTTFTAAASCETQNLALADQRAPFNFLDEEDTPVLWRSECDFPSLASDCQPSASEYWDLHTLFKSGDIEGYQGWAVYHSPASICPLGWETVGLASLSSGAETASQSGIFTKNARPDPTLSLGGWPLYAADWLVGALEEGEQMIWCCPKNHTVYTNGVCLSKVGPWDPQEYDQFSTICNYGYADEPTEIATVTSFDGTSWNPPLLSYDFGDEQSFTSYKETLPATVAATTTSADFEVVHSVVALVLVNKSTDNGDNGDNHDSTGGNDNDNNDDDSKDNNDNGDSGGSDGDNDDAAPSTRALSFLPFTMVGIGLLAGMGILMPW